MSGLYQSGWNPPGVRKDWERCSMTTDSTERFLGRMAEGLGKCVDSVGWFSDAGVCRVLVADFDSGRRMTVRTDGRNWKADYTRTPKAKPSPEASLMGDR